MKNIFLKLKNKRSKIIAIFVLLLFIVVYACHEELDNSLGNESNKRAIELAKSWYEMNKPALPAFRSSDRSVEVPMKPEWSRALSKKNDKYEIVETDIMTFGMIMFVHPECMEKFKETQDEKYRRSYSRLVFRTDRKTNKTVGFLMTQMPNPEFLEKSNFKPFRKTNYLERDKDFGGWIVFHNLDGSFSNGWVYEDGKITGKIKNMDIGDVGLNFRSGGCYWIDWYFELWDCPSWYIGGEDGYPYFCTLIYTEYLGQTVICENEDDGNNDPGGGYDPGGGGNPPDPPIPPDPPEVILTAPKVITIMDSYNLSVSVANIDCDTVEFKINNQYTLQIGSSMFCNQKAKKAGFWTIKAIVNGSYESNEEKIEVQYPDVSIISSDPIVLGAMSSAWTTTKNSASSSGRQEYGFWIYVNTNMMSYDTDSATPGAYISGCVGTHANIQPGIPSEQISFDPSSGGRYAVAHFHTHTPLTHCTNYGAERTVGPSGTDDSVLRGSSYGVPGLVYDYIGDYYSKIYAGHNLNAAAQVYTFSVSQRDTPLF